MKKILMVIPVYNEEKNIKKVLNDIRENSSQIDILVINDCSKDKTEEILIEEKIKYINHIFNMGYARSIQTGIKYGFYNNYDYIIQFDGDGQHLAKEANKLLKKIEKDDLDIIIGSRFLTKTNYQHNFFRKLGTKLFTEIIKISCKKNITDPTSGFQCINRKVMNYYIQLGNYPEYPDANLIIELFIKGFKIGEVPVEMACREYGESMHSGILKPIKYMVKVLYTIFIIILKDLFGGKKK